jgi:hypothetical protein
LVAILGWQERLSSLLGRHLLFIVGWIERVRDKLMAKHISGTMISPLACVCQSTIVNAQNNSAASFDLNFRTTLASYLEESIALQGGGT